MASICSTSSTMHGRRSISAVHCRLNCRPAPQERRHSKDRPHRSASRGEHVTITGPFAPGKTPVQLGFALPNAGASLTIRQTLPAALDQVFVAAEKIGPMQLSSPQLRETREITSEGQVFLMGSGDRLNAGDTLVLQLSGLPARSPAAAVCRPRPARSSFC